MCEPTGKLADGFHFLRLEALFLRIAPLGEFGGGGDNTGKEARFVVRGVQGEVEGALARGPGDVDFPVDDLTGQRAVEIRLDLRGQAGRCGKPGCRPEFLACNIGQGRADGA
jgi:hypothetical protein